MRTNTHLIGVGQNHVCMVYVRYFWQGFHQKYGVFIQSWPTLHLRNSISLSFSGTWTHSLLVALVAPGLILFQWHQWHLYSFSSSGTGDTWTRSLLMALVAPGLIISQQHVALSCSGISGTCTHSLLVALVAPGLIIFQQHCGPWTHSLLVAVVAPGFIIFYWHLDSIMCCSATTSEELPCTDPQLQENNNIMKNL